MTEAVDARNALFKLHDEFWKPIRVRQQAWPKAWTRHYGDRSAAYTPIAPSTGHDQRHRIRVLHRGEDLPSSEAMARPGSSAALGRLGITIRRESMEALLSHMPVLMAALEAAYVSTKQLGASAA